MGDFDLPTTAIRLDNAIAEHLFGIQKSAHQRDMPDPMIAIADCTAGLADLDRRGQLSILRLGHPIGFLLGFAIFHHLILMAQNPDAAGPHPCVTDVLRRSKRDF